MIHVQPDVLKKLLEANWTQAHRDPDVRNKLMFSSPSKGMKHLVEEVVRLTMVALENVVPVIEAPKDPQHYKPGEGLSNNNFCIALLGIVCSWNEGEPIVFQQQDFDNIPGHILLEGMTASGDFCLKLEKKMEGQVQ